MRDERLSRAAVLWFVALAAALLLDRPIAQWLAETGMAQHVKRVGWPSALAQFAKIPGEYRAVLILAGLAWLCHPLRWRAGGFVCLTGAASLLNGLVKWLVGRPRPYTSQPGGGLLEPFAFDPMHNGWHGLFHATNLSFPSGHASCAFAAATGAAILFPRWRWVFYAAATATAIERVLEDAHYASDVVAAAGLAWIVVHVLARVLSQAVPDDAPSPAMARSQETA